MMLPIASIAFMVPLDTVTRIFLNGRDEFLDVTQTFDSIVSAMGGLVMKPYQGPIRFPDPAKAR